ncbi:MAG: hypothetical protein U5K77_00600 [Candidatus Saccharibacteria bacterium]|nr:hypothetical protein [Candidatus Saccharibacteria bacterium]
MSQEQKVALPPQAEFEPQETVELLQAEGLREVIQVSQEGLGEAEQSERLKALTEVIAPEVKAQMSAVALETAFEQAEPKKEALTSRLNYLQVESNDQNTWVRSLDDQINGFKNISSQLFSMNDGSSVDPSDLGYMSSAFRDYAENFSLTKRNIESAVANKLEAVQGMEPEVKDAVLLIDDNRAHLVEGVGEINEDPEKAYSEEGVEQHVEEREAASVEEHQEQCDEEVQANIEKIADLRDDFGEISTGLRKEMQSLRDQEGAVESLPGVARLDDIGNQLMMLMRLAEDGSLSTARLQDFADELTQVTRRLENGADELIRAGTSERSALDDLHSRISDISSN